MGKKRCHIILAATAFTDPVVTNDPRTRVAKNKPWKKTKTVIFWRDHKKKPHIVYTFTSRPMSCKGLDIYRQKQNRTPVRPSVRPSVRVWRAIIQNVSSIKTSARVCGNKKMNHPKRRRTKGKKSVKNAQNLPQLGSCGNKNLASQKVIFSRICSTFETGNLMSETWVAVVQLYSNSPSFT